MGRPRSGVRRFAALEVATRLPPAADPPACCSSVGPGAPAEGGTRPHNSALQGERAGDVLSKRDRRTPSLRHPRQPFRPRAARSWPSPGRPPRRPTRGCCVLNEPLAAELGLDPDLAAQPATACGLLVGTARPGRRHPGGAGLRRTPVRRLRARGSATAGRCCSASSSTPTAGCATCTSRAPAGRRSRAAATGWPRSGPMLREYVVSEAMHALGIPTTRSLAVVATGRTVRRETVLPGAVLARVAEQPPAGRQLPVRPGHRRRRPAAPARRPRDRPAPPGRRRRRQPLPRPVRRGGRRPGVAGGAVDAGRVRARGDEHRQHDDLRGDHRLRAVRVHGGLRPGHGLQLDRHGRPLRLRQPAGRGRRGTSPGWPRPCCRCSTTTRSRRSTLAIEALGAFRRAVRRRLVGRHARQARPARRTRRADLVDPLVDELLALLAARATSTTPRSSAPSARLPAATREPVRGLVLDLPAFDAWPSAGSRWARTPTRWTGSTRSTSRATTWSRRRSPRRPPATSRR